MRYTIKRGSYCPNCRGVALSDHTHTELPNNYDEPKLIKEIERLQRELQAAKQDGELLRKKLENAEEWIVKQQDAAKAVNSQEKVTLAKLEAALTDSRRLETLDSWITTHVPADKPIQLFEEDGGLIMSAPFLPEVIVAGSLREALDQLVAFSDEEDKRAAIEAAKGGVGE